MRRLTWLVALISAPALASSQLDRTRAAEDAWGRCVVRTAHDFAGRAAPADVVEAAFGECAAQEAAFRTQLQRYSTGGGWFGGYTRWQLEDRVELTRRAIKQQAMASVLRSATTRPTTPPSAAPGSP